MKHGQAVTRGQKESSEPLHFKAGADRKGNSMIIRELRRHGNQLKNHKGNFQSEKIPFRKVYIAACVICTPLHSPAFSQVTQPRINQELIDRFSVERKTGRFALRTSDQIKIGSSEESSLAVSYGPVDGSDFQQSGIPRMAFNQIRKEGTLNYYDYLSIEFNEVNETFRRNTGSSDAFVTQYPTGSTLIVSGDHYIFTDKFGIVIDFSPNERVVTYPDGREIRFMGTSASISFEDRDRPYRSAKNNFGYMLKFTGSSSHIDIQAVNLAVDYCDLTSSTYCSGLTQTRQASANTSAGERVLTDAGGGITRYTFHQLYAFDYERICYVTDYISQCPDPPSWYRWYPVTVTLPGFSSPNYTISHVKKGDIHDDIFVSSVQMGSLLASYNTTKSKFGSWGSNPYNLAFYIDTQMKIGEQLIGNSRAIRPVPEWGSARRALISWTDDLGRQTGYSRDERMEISGETLPEGNNVQIYYDIRNNVSKRVVSPKPGSTLGQEITYLTYPSTCSPSTLAYCNKPTSVTDPNGNMTEYEYNSRGQIEVETRPAPTAGAPRPKKVYTYTPRTAYIKDAAGNIVAAGPAISLPTQMVVCDTTSTCTGGANDILTQYDYGPLSGANNLNLRGVAVTAMGSSGLLETHRTCYKYNYFGEKIAETKPNAGLASCS
ncbi:hypothetical protein NDN01_02575 [Sphingomonas sp. QA11]|uniref:hypothetical protein n=1 Tax=Sphingomonas sp. QA11 TaxID=2950605 RepID=UPI00234B2B0E|nr:hypothetical protein [Sphingomonas sp. QA11]WCM27833.1 hypothetical protein NDN01_02575 [Sphingomonas sp. QA11]